MNTVSRTLHALCTLIGMSGGYAQGQQMEPQRLPSCAEEVAPDVLNDDAPRRVTPCTCMPQRALEAHHTLEVSFGTTQNFNEPSRWTEPGRRILPTTSATLIAELLLNRWWAVGGFFNLPLVESRALQADGTMTWEAADPVLALGGRWAPVQREVLGGKGLAALQLGVFLGTTVTSIQGDSVVPVLTTRLHLHDATGLTVYLGASWAFVRESLALSYGLGYRF